jgi:hypothetical protein
MATPRCDPVATLSRLPRDRWVGRRLTFEIILRNPDRAAGEPPHRFASFTVNDASIEKMCSTSGRTSGSSHP